MSENFPFNKLNREAGEKKLAEETFNRVTLSFYKYVIIPDPNELRNTLFFNWEKLQVLGRIYLATEGINAQLSVPEHCFDQFRKELDEISFFKGVPFKVAVEEPSFSFYKLTIKVRKQIVADGLSINDYDITNVGQHLNAKQWNEAINDGAIVVDMRNHYESEIGHFKNAILPDAETFREELPMVEKMLEGKEDENILLYCTGGIRCEKASAYLKHKGFKSINQLYGGIINYVHEVNENGLENKFIGKNFVFDDRLAERVSDEIISSCHQCEKPCDNHTNCKNLHCNLLFLQCEECNKKYQNCCSTSCIEIINLTEEEQKKWRSGRENKKMFHSHRKVNLKNKLK